LRDRKMSEGKHTQDRPVERPCREIADRITALTSQRDKLVKALEDLLAATDGARSGYIDFSEPALRWEARYKQVRHEVETTLSQTKEGV